MSIKPETVSVEASDPEVLPDVIEWRVHPLTENVWKSTLLVLIIAATCYGVWQWTEWPGMVILGLVMMVTAVAPYLFPTNYRITDDGIEIRFLGVRNFRSWDEFRNFYPHHDGVHLSTFRKPSGLDAFRGSYVRFAGDNRDEILRFLARAIRSRKPGKEKDEGVGQSEGEAVPTGEADAEEINDSSR